jgi:ATP-dependent Clp protease protease subunit
MKNFNKNKRNCYEYFIKNPDYKISNLLLDNSFNNREISINSITAETAEQIDNLIRLWNSIDEESIQEERTPIKIYINSLGGSLSAALSIVDSIKLSRTPVCTINRGNVCKESFYIFLAGMRRYSYPRSSFYFEKGLKPFNINDSIDDNYNAYCDTIAAELKSMILENTKISESEYEKRNGWWITAEKSYELKISHEVLRSKFL